MNNILKYGHFIINERHHVNQDVRHLTNLIYNKINYYLSKLILNKEVVINNLLQDSYKTIKFKNDKIILKLGNKHGVVKSIKINNGIIEDLVLELTIKLSEREIKNKYLIDNRVKETINHECQHVVEFEKRGGVKTGSWKFDERLKIHENRFKNYCKIKNIDDSKWLEITHIFYLVEPHEIRSSVSQLLEYIKNTNINNKDIEDIIKNSDIYQKYKDISSIGSTTILKKMRLLYPNFNQILDDFIKNVIINKNNNIDEVFDKEIKFVIKRAKDCLNKLLNFNEEYEDHDHDRHIDYSQYVLNPIVENRDKKIDELLGPPTNKEN